MHSSIILIASVGAAMALPNAASRPKASQLCSHPDSNCEIVTNRHGRNVTRFKEDKGPGSDAYHKVFGKNMEKLKRDDDDDVTTHVTIGKKEMGYYCGGEDDIKISDYVINALNTLCSDTACDEGSDWTVPSKYVDSGEGYHDATVTINAEGTYPSGMMVHFVDALGSVPANGAVTTEEYNYSGMGYISVPKTCTAKKMANYAKVAKFQGINMVGSMDFTAALTIDDSTDTCETVNSILGAVSGGISGIAAGFFGIVNVLCDD